MASYDEEFKKRIVRMHLEEGRTIKSLSEEYHVSENGIGYWLKKYREECSKDPAAKEEYDLMKENLKLRKELIISTVDGFIIPALPDMFSMYGIQNIGNSLQQWQHEFEDGCTI